MALRQARTIDPSAYSGKDPRYATEPGAFIRLLEEGQPLVECPGLNGGACTHDGHCRLKSRLRAAEAVFIDPLDRSTLADVALSPSTVA